MRGGYVNNHWVPFVRTDPENRCAAMLVFGQKVNQTFFIRLVLNGATTFNMTLSIKGLHVTLSIRTLCLYVECRV
jgi:hypothetical protein